MYFQLSPILGRWGVKLGLVGVVVGGAISFGSPTLAQVVPDNTLGIENSVVTDIGSGVDTISGGATRGGNLFHSFQQFSVPTNGAAFFNNAANIQNILTRVTGGSVSNIDGLIQANGAANLFLLNPNGIVFGQNARLNIGGSFIATTASSINFADGTQFSATPGTGAPLLTVSVPLGLQFGAGSGNIINRASGVGLQVQPGRAIGLVGGNINLEGGRLTAEGGRIELGAVAAPGVVGIGSDSSGFRFSFPTDLALADISLSNTALVDVRAGGGGNIAVNTRNLDLFGGSALVAGIGGNQGSADAVAGDVDIYAQDTIAIDGVGEFPEGVFSSGIFSNVGSDGTGKAGNINIRTGSLSLRDRAVLNVSNFGQGDAGNIFVQADNSISLSNSDIFSNVSGGAIGNGGTVSIKADSLFLSNGSRIIAAIGNGTSSLPGGRGNGGDVIINVRSSFSADGTDSNGLSSAVFTSVGSGAEGNGGNVNITTGSLSLTNGAYILASTFGRGDAGDVMINARDGIVFDGVSSDSFSAGVFSNVGETGRGNGGDIDLTARSLLLTNGGNINASTFGQGNAGRVTISTSDWVSLSSNSTIFSSVGGNATGNGGDIDIKTRSLSLTNGGQIAASTFGRGNAGNIALDVSDTISFQGSSSDGFSSGVSSIVGSGGRGNGGNITINAQSLSFGDSAEINARTFGTGDAGNIRIKARSLSLTSGARLDSSTLGAGNAGNIFMQIDESINLANSSYIFSNVESGAVGNGGTVDIRANSLSLIDGAQIATSTSGLGDAGSINIEASDTISFDGINSRGFSSGIFSVVGEEGRGNGGNIDIETRSLTMANDGQLTTSSFGQGDAGNIDVTVRTLELDKGDIFATSTLGDGGNIQLQASKELRLRNGSQISTQSSSGGNLTIESPLIIASFNGNNDIVTNALFGRGGRLEITAESIFGLTPRSLPELQILFGTDDPAQFDLSLFSSNDVASISSNPIISAAEVFLNPNLAELPTTPVDASTLVASGCPSGAENRFVVAGRGGLPPAPGDKLSTDALLTDWATLETPETENRAAVETTTPETANTTATSLVEATTWQFGSKGEIILSNANRTTPSQLNATPSNCHSS